MRNRMGRCNTRHTFTWPGGTGHIPIISINPRPKRARLTDWSRREGPARPTSTPSDPPPTQVYYLSGNPLLVREHPATQQVTSRTFTSLGSATWMGNPSDWEGCAHPLAAGTINQNPEGSQTAGPANGSSQFMQRPRPMSLRTQQIQKEVEAPCRATTGPTS